MGARERLNGETVRTAIAGDYQLFAYEREWDTEKRAILARTYWEITGEDIDLRQPMLAD